MNLLLIDDNSDKFTPQFDSPDFSTVPESAIATLIALDECEEQQLHTHGAHRLAEYPVDRPWVLCIDDDAEFLHGLKLKLQQRGYDVVRAHEGEEGYKFAFKFNPVMILLDLHMPHTTGEEVLAQLRQHPDTSRIPVVIMTGLNEHGLELRMHSLGAHQVFRKPVPLDALADAVDHYLNNA
ncbi:response regulator [Rubripirellula reticaptiva]|uniref:Polar-differentiation response regulator DivK n=1 Tax=Rubripirellula reticaptiva TaxID=2528013 RepID=A0A5C6ERZ2_9BACT|nr:response regulator [Rubripirellula reticaptiva]TWU51748.1 Polar-differentiation response regulator DivK [Rubripirellula reticaptiva]